MSSIEKAVARLSGQADDAAARTNAERVAHHASVSTEASPDPSGTSKPQIRLRLRRLARAGYITPDTMQGQLAEQFRHIKRPILKNVAESAESRRDNRNLIAITSAHKGEGKTFTAFNLAMSISMERDLSVLLVDSDLIARSLTNLVGLNGAPGLTDVLVDSAVGIGDVIVGTNVAKLSLIPAGRVRENTTELLGSERMRRVVGELSSRYSNRIVLFDTAPILTTSQALVLDALVGQIVVVVEEGNTSQQAIQDAVALLEKNKDVGMVLNKSRRKLGKNYGAYYGYS